MLSPSLLIIVLMAQQGDTSFVPPVERIFQSGDELATWCVDEMRSRYAAKGITTYGSAIRPRVEGNAFVADVRLSVDGEHRRAHCSVAIGGRERQATFAPEDPRIR